MTDTQDQNGSKTYILLHPSDNTATALIDLQKGEVLQIFRGAKREDVRIENPIPFAHKFAILPIPKGAEVRKYGEVIGEASEEIRMGDYVHVHNVTSRRTRGQGR